MNVYKSSPPTPHFVLVPLLAPGHMIPMVDMAGLIAARGALVTFITTPVNAARIGPVIDRAKRSGLPVRFVELKFPSAEAGLPEGCENFDLIDLTDMHAGKALFDALTLFREPLKLHLRQASPRPDCIVTDFCQSWTMEVARELGVPRIIFHGPSCIHILATIIIREHKVYETVAGEFEPVVLPGLPQRTEIARAQAPGWFDHPGWEKLRKHVLEAEATADGVVVNTFQELEPELIELYRKTIRKSVWPIGPLALYNKDMASKAARGSKSSIDEHRVVSWLDSMELGSVIFVSFGSHVRTAAAQLVEIGCGLEASNRPFIWVIKEADRSPRVEEWMSEGFEARTRERSLIITGWAPQVVILSHPAIGGFVTHCGWNSAQEALSAGVPMITWPHFADQFINEKLVVEVLRAGITLGVQKPSYVATEVVVTRDNLAKAVLSLMDGGEEGEERRRRARQFGEMARKAMEEGGSSYESLAVFIEHFKHKRDLQRKLL